MKSLLVDALRQAHSSRQGKTLSDSGSFDTTNPDFANTANDPEVDGVVAPPEELSLFKTSTLIGLQAETPDAQRGDDAEFDETLERTRPRAATHGFDSDRPESAVDQKRSGVPALARLAPLYCVMAALLAALSWGFFQSSELGRAGIAKLESQARETGGERPGSTPSSGAAAERFPFINSEKLPEGQESAQ